jgi:hypothetical protein
MTGDVLHASSTDVQRHSAALLDFARSGRVVSVDWPSGEPRALIVPPGSYGSEVPDE